MLRNGLKSIIKAKRVEERMMPRGSLYLSEEDVNSLRSTVTGYFPVYSTMIEGDSVVFFCEIDEDSLEKKFDELRIGLREKGYIPILKRSKGEYLLYITPFDRKKGRSIYVNLVMLLLTMLSTTFAGIIHWASYTGSADDIYSLSNISNGILYFAFPLLLILGTHEMGHYFMAKKRNVRASLPFFMPFMPPLGTMGAFISLREPIPDKKSLLDIGIAGPIAGFIVAVPVTIIGMFLGGLNPPADTVMNAGTTYMIIEVPLIYQFLTLFIPSGAFMHPTAFAGWVGFIVTAINLFPAGQLDGGHIARAALGDKATYASYGSLIVLFLIGIFTGYWGWIIFGSLIFFLGLRHGPPLNDITPLDRKRKGLALLAAVMLAISFVSVPMDVYTPSVGISLTPMDEGAEMNFTVEPGSEIDFNFTVKNTGEGLENLSIFVSAPENWNATVFQYGSTKSNGVAFNEELYIGEARNYTLVLQIPDNATPFIYGVSITASFAGVWENLNLNVLIPGNLSFSMMVLPQSVSAVPGEVVNYTADMVSLSNESQELTFSVAAPPGWEIIMGSGNASSHYVELNPYESARIRFSIAIPENTANGSYAVVAILSSPDGSVQSAYLSITVVQERSSA